MAGPSLGRTQRLIHIEAAVLDRLRAVRRPGESYGDLVRLRASLALWRNVRQIRGGKVASPLTLCTALTGRRRRF